MLQFTVNFELEGHLEEHITNISCAIPTLTPPQPWMVHHSTISAVQSQHWPHHSPMDGASQYSHRNLLIPMMGTLANF